MGESERQKDTEGEREGQRGSDRLRETVAKDRITQKDITNERKKEQKNRAKRS